MQEFLSVSQIAHSSTSIFSMLEFLKEALLLSKMKKKFFLERKTNTCNVVNPLASAFAFIHGSIGFSLVYSVHCMAYAVWRKMKEQILKSTEIVKSFFSFRWFSFGLLRFFQTFSRRETGKWDKMCYFMYGMCVYSSRNRIFYSLLEWKSFLIYA